MLISPEYRDMQRQMHKDRPDYGSYGSCNVDLVRKACLWGRRRALDYGAGKGALATALGPAYRMTNYDPAIEGIDEPPEPHPVVICSNVLEHIEPECVDEVLRDIRRVTQQTALLFIHIGPANAILPDGKNAHLIQEPKEWWKQKLEAADLHVMTDGDGVGPDGQVIGYWAECMPC